MMKEVIHTKFYLRILKIFSVITIQLTFIWVVLSPAIFGWFWAERCVR